ncbi:DUF58 domain-containing protein [Actinosynnema pretiosum subsp. pretiosum]|uniref:DUF58 domain-containing protein n=1 Tax=Actinosynnema pretiosum subsp. pretiosum TaxID=103721 RepID=A0AA45LDJ9_9PSEU|nr:putative CONSERVED SECRETED PROTEIN [Actinosynnema pretiosum subsp. pretiosum]QUF07583.1 DUF58 domain-containing protein [Actinosynnema pretiosum subsp. pretiosum]
MTGRDRDRPPGAWGAPWRGTDALARGLLLGVVLVVAGVLAHRVVLVLFGAPLLVTTVLALLRPPGGAPDARVRLLSRVGEIGKAGAVVDVVADGELVAVRLPVPGREGPGPVHLLPASTTAVSVVLDRSTWGDGVDVRPDHLVAGPDGLVVHGPVTAPEWGRAILPPIAPLPTGLLPARARGLVGVHRSRGPGDSVELRDIRAFAPGDRLRRVDWRVSLRTGNLHVREHHAETDADVVLALDTRADVEADVALWTESGRGSPRPGGSLDLAARAAVSLAAAYLRQGDRVGLVDLGRPALWLRPGSGRRQLLALRSRLVACARVAGWAQRPVLDARQAPTGAVVVVLSPFLDDEVVEVAVHAARRGHPVLAVDVLPTDLRPDRETEWGAAALRVVELEHEVRVTALRSHGVPVIRWDGESAVVATALHATTRPRR